VDKEYFASAIKPLLGDPLVELVGEIGDGAIPRGKWKKATGFIVRTLKDALEAVGRVPEFSPKRCREVFEQRLTATRMADDYVRVYEPLINSKQGGPSKARA
jgi:hypothetical protein